ncbi:MAG: universal stress protein [Pseudomonadota bacterium]
MFDTILVSHDGSDHSCHALSRAAELAKILGSDLHLTHTPQMDTPSIVVGALVAPLDRPPSADQIAAAGKHIVDGATRLAADQGVEFAEVHLGAGDPARYTLAVARRIDADLIVLGRRGLGAVGSLALGSVSQAVSHGATCACLTVL